MTYLDEMVEQYAETALWSSLNYDWINAHENGTEDDSPYTGENLDDDFDTDDIHPDTLAEMRRDCGSFLESARDGEWNGTGADLIGDMDAGQTGHDFWLTRNEHGAGFWDRGLGERGDRLTKAAHPYGDYDLYIGDDGMVHGQ